ncbi:MAG: BamA/TamA family outer membrane protein [Ferruginibacter sp.]|nr:BamA/TamA family outer membrane protein [Cytophagales bacterium]
MPLFVKITFLPFLFAAIFGVVLRAQVPGVPSDSGQMPPDSTKRTDTARARRGRVNVIPIVYSTPEAGVGFGARVVYVFRNRQDTRNRPSTFPVTLVYTTKRQTIARAQADWWWKQNLYHLSGQVGYLNYPFKFYGVGNQQPNEAEEFYTTQLGDVFVQGEKRIAPNLYAGGRYEFRYEQITRKEPNRILDTRAVRGAGGQRSSGLGLTLGYDTRDNIFQPTGGHFHQFSALAYPVFLGSRDPFGRYRLDLRRYVGAFSGHTLAFQAQFTVIGGKPPFQQLALIGGPDLARGYFEGRFRDRNMMVYQAEYRLPLPFFGGRFKAVAFGSAGQVANRPGDYSLDGFHYAAGAGLRYRFNQEGLNIRFDVAYGQTSFLYFAFNEAF